MLRDWERRISSTPFYEIEECNDSLQILLSDVARSEFCASLFLIAHKHAPNINSTDTSSWPARGLSITNDQVQKN